MKYLNFCLLLTLCFVWVKSVAVWKKIDWFGVEVNNDPPSFNITWRKVDSIDDQDLVIGYKVHIWEVKKIKKLKSISYANGTSEEVIVEEYPRAKRRNGANVIPEGNLTILEAPASNPMVHVEGIKLEVPYQFTITAYTKNMESPPSAISGITVHGPDWKSKYEI